MRAGAGGAIEWLDGARDTSLGWEWKLTLRGGHETARLNGTAAGDGTAEFGCCKHDAGLMMSEVMGIAELRWTESRNGQQLMGFAGFWEETRSRKLPRDVRGPTAALGVIRPS